MNIDITTMVVVVALVAFSLIVVVLLRKRSGNFLLGAEVKEAEKDAELSDAVRKRMGSVPSMRSTAEVITERVKEGQTVKIEPIARELTIEDSSIAPEGLLAREAQSSKSE